ncbi:lipoprotein-releasing system ATP-binding protein LolD [Candidatus Woesearchaeota archaeon]|nr:MAG: lipoprotein-releasing system ATP-binding protein LolD [Candidatus Woesearchaeota archaeon]
MKQEALLSIENVEKTYKMGKAGDLTVLKGINLQIFEGEFVAITGPSGSGKSTMMNIVGALDIPSKGVVYLNGKNIAKMGESSLSRFRGETIGFIFQQFNLIPTLSALENVMLPMEFINNSSQKKTRDTAKNLLDMLGLGDRIHHRPNELSGGQQQRVAIARSLSNDPEIILADEPTGNLDSKTGKFVMGFLHDLNKKKGKTVILITHDLHLIKYADRVIYLQDGIIVKDTNKGDKK